MTEGEIAYSLILRLQYEKLVLEGKLAETEEKLAEAEAKLAASAGRSTGDDASPPFRAV